MRKIKIAQIGTSHRSHGNDIFNTLKRLDDIFEIVGYAMPENEEEKFEIRMKDFEGYRKMSVDEILDAKDIEAVFIETEEVYLTKYALMAAEKGKHIHIEKPGGTDLSEFELLINKMKKTGKVFHPGYMYRYNPHIVKLMDSIQNGELGEIISVEAQMSVGGSHSEKSSSWLKSLPGGMMFFLGCHIVDLIVAIQGEPEKITSFYKCYGDEASCGAEFSMAVFEYKNGISFAKTTSLEPGGYSRRCLVVNGTNQTHIISPLEAFAYGEYLQTTTLKRDIKDNQWVDVGVTEKSGMFDRYEAMLRSFASMVSGEIENPRSYDYELMLYKTILRAGGVSDV